MRPSIVIVGAGPRGISVLERLGAHLQDAGFTGSLDVHIVDDAQLGAGRIWDTEQTHTLCMNTLAGAVTLFTEPGATVSASVVEGPTMYEWIQILRGEKVRDEAQEMFDRFPEEVDSSFADEIRKTRVESNPSRALYGAYLRWCFRVALGLMPENITVHQHQSRVVSITEQDDYDEIALADGTQIVSQATVLATGWQQPHPTAEEEQLAAASATWIAPGNPLDQDIHRIPAGEKVLVRGLGMGFFDVMALTTIDRGGKFVEDADARSGLRYIPSGQEPHFMVSSGRGYPYLPKSEYKSLPPKADVPRLKAVIADLNSQERIAERIDFGEQVYPAIVKDAYEAYYRVLARTNPQALSAGIESLVDAIDASELSELDVALELFVPEPQDRFSLSYWQDPVSGIVGDAKLSVEELTSRIADRMVFDIEQALLARDSAVKAGLWSLSASRKPASILGSEGRYTYDSRLSLYKSFMAFGQMIGSGPPLFRTRQLLALVDAGLVSFIGARPQVRMEGNEFVMTGKNIADEIRASTLVDAWMYSPDTRRPVDPSALSIQSRTRPFRETFADGSPVATGSPEVVPETRQLVNPDGTADSRLHLIGIPTYAQLPDTTISPMPGTNPLMLQETDKVSAHLLEAVGVK